jgi:hypothetical protein
MPPSTIRGPALTAQPTGDRRHTQRVLLDGVVIGSRWELRNHTWAAERYPCLHFVAIFPDAASADATLAEHVRRRFACPGCDPVGGGACRPM